MKPIVVLAALLTAAAVGGCTAGDNGEAAVDQAPEVDATYVANAAPGQNGAIAALSDSAFFATIQFQKVDVAPAAAPWAQSRHLTTLDAVDGLRFSSSSRAELRLYMVAGGAAYRALYLERNWTEAAGWQVTSAVQLTGDVTPAAGGYALDGLGFARRNAVQGGAALTVTLDRDIDTAGAAGQSFVVRDAWSSESYRE